MTEQEKSSEQNNEPNVFSFKDEYGTYKIPAGLKQLCDGLENSGFINAYLSYLVIVAVSQQAEYKDKPLKGFLPEKGMDSFITARNEAIQLYKEENIFKLETYLGIDSRGIEAKDRRPLLGVDIEIVKALAHYVHKEAGYQEIDEK